MKFLMIGVNYKTLNTKQRESFYFRESDKLTFSTQLLSIVNQSLILSTCNRSEVYIIVDDLFDENILKDFFLSYFHQKDVQVYLYSNKQAIKHLLRVTCGLDSMVIGEDQILHQVKDALSWTMEQHFSGKELNYIFQSVIRFAKEMRKVYAINDHPLSVSYIGYQIICKYLNDNDKIMVCGSGEIAALMIKYLKDHQLYLVNRTYENIVPYLNEKRTFVPFDKRYDYLKDVHIIISATSSPHYIFKANQIKDTQSLIFLDLAMPRDIDDELKKYQNIKVIDLDDLQDISHQHLKQRKDICLKIEEEIDVEINHIFEGLSFMKSDSLIEQMQKRYLNLSNETYELLKKKLNLNSKEEYILKKVLDTSFLRLMKEPIQLLKSGDKMQQEQYIELIQKIIDIKEKHE